MPIKICYWAATLSATATSSSRGPTISYSSAATAGSKLICALFSDTGRYIPPTFTDAFANTSLKHPSTLSTGASDYYSDAAIFASAGVSPGEKVHVLCAAVSVSNGVILPVPLFTGEEVYVRW